VIALDPGTPGLGHCHPDPSEGSSQQSKKVNPTRIAQIKSRNRKKYPGVIGVEPTTAGDIIEGHYIVIWGYAIERAG
jgi:hypothetical protein